MLDQMRISPVDRAEYETAIAHLAEDGIEAWIEDNALVLGPHATLHLPDLTLITTLPYADGYASGQQQCRQAISTEDAVSLTDHEVTEHIDRALPADLLPAAHNDW